MNKKDQQPKTLRVIGTWATIWWGVSCAWVLYWVWLSRNTYVTYSVQKDAHGFFSTWAHALSNTYRTSAWLEWLFLVIVCVWVIGAIKWLYLLKKHEFSYRAAFKDLFLTIRK
jgi:hypothetical protein